MNITLEFNSHNEEDVRMFPHLGQFLNKAYHEYGKVGDTSAVIETTEVVEPSPEKEEHIEEPVPEEKPKRTRKPRAKKEETTPEPVEVEAPTPDEVAAAEIKEEDTAVEPETPVEVEEKPQVVEERPQVEEVKNTCTGEEWRKALAAKQMELGIYKLEDGIIVPGVNIDRKDAFNKFVCEMSAPFGSNKPSQLDPVNRYKFMPLFTSIYWDENDNKFNSKAPF